MAIAALDEAPEPTKGDVQKTSCIEVLTSDGKRYYLEEYTTLSDTADLLNELADNTFIPTIRPLSEILAFNYYRAY